MSDPNPNPDSNPNPEPVVTPLTLADRLAALEAEWTDFKAVSKPVVDDLVKVHDDAMTEGQTLVGMLKRMGAELFGIFR